MTNVFKELSLLFQAHSVCHLKCYSIHNRRQSKHSTCQSSVSLRLAAAIEKVISLSIIVNQSKPDSISFIILNIQSDHLMILWCNYSLNLGFIILCIGLVICVNEAKVKKFMLG